MELARTGGNLMTVHHRKMLRLVCNDAGTEGDRRVSESLSKRPPTQTSESYDASNDADTEGDRRVSKSLSK